MHSLKSPATGTEAETKASNVLDKIRELMHLLGIRQKDLACNLNIKPSQISHYFNHRSEIKANNLLAILELIGMNVEEQLDEKISMLKNGPHESSNTATFYTKLGRIREPKKESLLKIIRMLGD